MLQTSLLLMKSLNKTETPIFLSVVCSLFPKAIFLTFIYPVLCNANYVYTNSANLLTISLISHVINQIILSKLFNEAKF